LVLVPVAEGAVAAVAVRDEWPLPGIGGSPCCCPFVPLNPFNPLIPLVPAVCGRTGTCPGTGTGRGWALSGSRRRVASTPAPAPAPAPAPVPAPEPLAAPVPAPVPAPASAPCRRSCACCRLRRSALSNSPGDMVRAVASTFSKKFTVVWCGGLCCVVVVFVYQCMGSERGRERVRKIFRGRV
jgi:hypothetical protein